MCLFLYAVKIDDIVVAKSVACDRSKMRTLFVYYIRSTGRHVYGDVGSSCDGMRSLKLRNLSTVVLQGDTFTT